jgi:hypothetical protein
MAGGDGLSKLSPSARQSMLSGPFHPLPAHQIALWRLWADSPLMRSWVLEAKLITTQPENFRFQLAACGKAKKFSDRKIAVRLARHCWRQAEHRNELRLL